MGDTTLDGTDEEKDLGVYITSDFKSSTQNSSNEMNELSESVEEILQVHKYNQQLLDTVQDIH